MTADFDDFVWPDTEAVPGPHISARDDEPLILFSDHYLPPRPVPDQDRDWYGKERAVRAWAGRNMVALSPVLTALQTNRYLGSEWWRRAATQTSRHSVIPTGRHSALPAPGYLALPSAASLAYRGRRRADPVSDWRWPAMVGSVAGAGLALVVLLVAASPVHRQGLTQPETGGGMVAISNGQLVPVPPCSLHHVHGDGLCVRKAGPVVSGKVYKLAASTRSTRSSTTALQSATTSGTSSSPGSGAPSYPGWGPWDGWGAAGSYNAAPSYGAASYGNPPSYGAASYGNAPSYGAYPDGSGRHARPEAYEQGTDAGWYGGRHAADDHSPWSSGRHAFRSGGRHAFRSGGRHALDSDRC